MLVMIMTRKRTEEEGNVNSENVQESLHVVSVGNETDIPNYESMMANTFDIDEDAYMWFGEYSHSWGFGLRKNDIKWIANKKPWWHQFTCDRQGVYRERKNNNQGKDNEVRVQELTVKHC